MGIETRKTDYSVEFLTLIREQYKNSPYFCKLLNILGERSQVLEDAIFSIKALDEQFGTVAGISRDNLERTALMFGVLTPQIKTDQDLIYEIRCFLITAFSRGLYEDMTQASKFIYDYESDVIDTEQGSYLVVYGDISSENGKKALLLYNCISKMAPATTELKGIIESGFGWFGFSNAEETPASGRINIGGFTTTFNDLPTNSRSDHFSGTNPFFPSNFFVFYRSGEDANKYYVTLNNNELEGRTPSHFVVNGNEYALTADNDLYISEVISRIGDRVSSLNLTNTYNIKFTDGTYFKAFTSSPVALSNIVQFKPEANSGWLDSTIISSKNFTRNNNKNSILDSTNKSLVEEKNKDHTILDSGNWRSGIAIENNVWVINDDTNMAIHYTHSNGTLTRAIPEERNDLNLGSPGPDYPRGRVSFWDFGVAIGNNVWVLKNERQPQSSLTSVHTNAIGYNYSNGRLTRASSKDLIRIDSTIGISSGYTGGFAIGNNVWFVGMSGELYGYGYSERDEILTRNSSNDTSLRDTLNYTGAVIGNKVWIRSVNLIIQYTYSNGMFIFSRTNLPTRNYAGGFAIGNNVWFISGNTLLSYEYTVSYTGGFAIGNNVWIIDNSNQLAKYYTYSNGTFTRGNTSNDLSLPVLNWQGGFAIGNNIWIIETDSNNNGMAHHYTLSGETLSPGTNDLILGRGFWQGGLAVGDNVWFINKNTNMAIHYTHSNGTLTRAIPEERNDLNLGRGNWQSGGAVGDNVWFINNDTNMAIHYTHSNGTLTRAIPEERNDLNLGTGDWESGFAIGNNIWFINDNSDTLVNFSRLSSNQLSNPDPNKRMAQLVVNEKGEFIGV